MRLEPIGENRDEVGTPNLVNNQMYGSSVPDMDGDGHITRKDVKSYASELSAGAYSGKVKQEFKYGLIVLGIFAALAAVGGLLVLAAKCAA